MKTELPLPDQYKSTVRGLLFCACLLLGSRASAQDLLKNGDFEQPLGATNWTVGYLCGGPDNFEIKDRTRAGAKGDSHFGAHFRPITLQAVHAYFTQTVTNLTPRHVYTVAGSMREDYWRDPRKHAFRDKFLVYLKVIGGRGAPTPDGRASVVATTPADANIDPPYTYPTSIWREFTAQQIPDAKGNIEVRLHYNKVGFVIYDKTWIMSGYFDDISLTP